MKEMRVKPFLEARTVALLAGLAIGLGIALHEAFFFVALLIALGVAIEGQSTQQPSISMFAI